MDGSTQGQSPVSEAGADKGEPKRERSSIGFPYQTLDEAVELAATIHKNVGAGECANHQLAPWLSLSQKSSTYRLRIYASRMFGVIESPSPGVHKLTDLGRRIVDPSQESTAKAEAFLEVPLFRAVFEKYRGNSLPPPAALEREFNTLGVAQKQTDKARSSFERSAQSAGYFNQGRDRLVQPGFAEGREAPPPQLPDKINNQPTPGGNNGGNGTRHPFIEGLLQTLPSPNTTWAVEGRVAWLKAAATCFDLIYHGTGSITIEGKADHVEAAEEEIPPSAA